jgi:hypothetical protein
MKGSPREGFLGFEPHWAKVDEAPTGVILGKPVSTIATWPSPRRQERLRRRECLVRLLLERYGWVA